MRKSALAVLFLAVWGCEKKTTTPETPKGAPDAAQTGSGGSAAAPGSDDVILIGEVGSLTGAEAAFGISTRNGIELAIDEANEAGGVKGKKLAVRVYDDQSKPEEAASAVTRLL